MKGVSQEYNALGKVCMMHMNIYILYIYISELCKLANNHLTKTQYSLHVSGSY